MLSRRQFLHLVASGVAAETLLPHCDPLLHAELLAIAQAGEVELKKRPARQSKSYGSGSFGNWITDASGLPCFEYLTNQTEDPTAATPVETAWRAPTDHTHQVGNDRLVAAVSNYGYVQIRQDEGGPKFLNDYRPDEGLYGAGLGFLTDGKEVLGTYYPGNGTSFERFFGTGYYRKRVVGTNFSVDQTLYAPFGDDPVLISEVTISSQTQNTANLHWAEYWGGQSYSFSHDAFLAGVVPEANGDQPDPAKITRLRRDFARRYEHRFERPDGDSALVESKILRPQAPAGRHANQEEVDRGDLAGVSPGVAVAEPPLPPPTFLAALNEGPVSFMTSAAEFFGKETQIRHMGAAGPVSVPVVDGLLRPAGLARIVPGEGVPLETAADDLTARGPDSALILLKPFILEAGSSVTLRFLYGYVPEGFTAAGLIAKYRGAGPELFDKSCAAWKGQGIQLATDSDPWIERETRWHSYYLRSGFTFDDLSGEHIVSQGSVYQYCEGLQTTPRDTLQHALPLVFSESGEGEPGLAKQVLRSTLKSQSADGTLPWAVAGFSQEISSRAPPSDLNLWLLWLASEYILGTRDTEFLGERLTSIPGRSGSREGSLRTVREKLGLAFHYLVANVGTGAHGLLRGRGGDWNEQIYFRDVAESLRSEVVEHSESVMNAAMAAYVFDHYARMLRYAGDAKAAAEAASHAEQQRGAVRAQWAGKWFQRLWLGPAKGWLTEERMWLEAQPWALLGCCATAEQQRVLVHSIETLTRKPSRIGAKQVGSPPGVKAINWPGVVAGETKNGGVYDTITGPLIWALARLDPAEADSATTDPASAFDEWRKNSRAHHAETFPDVWYGAWSGPDVFCSADSDHVGQTGYDWGLVDPDAAGRPNSYRGLSWTAWPVMNMHRHAWPLYSAAKLCGIEFTESGVDLNPAIPKAQWSFRSKLVGFEKTTRGYEGWYAPKKAGQYRIRLKVAADEASLTNLIINGNPQPAPLRQDGLLAFQGEAAREKPLRWSLLS